MRHMFLHSPEAPECLKAVPHSTPFKDALKYGFYELQNIHDWYREVTSDVGMHADLVKYWIRISTLLVTPVAPHFAEHIWTEFLKEPSPFSWPAGPNQDVPPIAPSSKPARTCGPP